LDQWAQSNVIQKNALLFYSFGAKYRYDEANGTFSFYEGEDLEIDWFLTNSGDAKSGYSLPVVYPETVYLVDGTHPEVFSANGSHGVWAAEGQDFYF
jgi:hypothetical protein